jgi:hypothetical protein
MKAESDAAKARAEQYEKRLLAEIDAEDARAKVDPPPELSPSERRERELSERIARLEGRHMPVAPLIQNSAAAERQSRRREQLRLLRNRIEAERLDKLTAGHVKRCSRQIKALEAQVSDIEDRLQAERERHRRAMDELNAERTSAAGKLGDLNRTLAPDETSEQRLEKVMA